MNSDFKALKKLADICRKAGIKHYKCDQFEFTLSDEGPISNYKKRSTKELVRELSNNSNQISSEDLTEEQLLLWSAPNPESGESQ